MNPSRQAVRLKHTNFQDDPLTVTLIINSREKGSRFSMDILTDGQVKERLPISMTADDLKEINQMLRDSMNRVVRHFSIKDTLSKDDLEAALLGLVRTGRHAFTEVFSDMQAREAMLALLSFSDQVIIQVMSEDFSLPWELLYSEPAGTPPSYENFWGMKYIISRVINRDWRSPVSPNIRVDSLPKLGLLAYKNLPSVADKEIPFFEQLKRDGKIILDKMPSLDPTPGKKDGELNKFKKFWNKSFNIAHFACHAYCVDEPRVDSFIQLSNGIHITLLDLKDAEITIKEYPLVILNACETGRINTMTTRHFAGDFIRYGARGVVATEHAVPDTLAFEFTEELYVHLLKGKKLGESMIETRRELLGRGNPIGLLYSLYAPAAIKLEYVKGAGA
jgi:hypothetical protein